MDEIEEKDDLGVKISVIYKKNINVFSKITEYGEGKFSFMTNQGGIISLINNFRWRILVLHDDNIYKATQRY